MNNPMTTTEHIAGEGNRYEIRERGDDWGGPYDFHRDFAATKPEAEKCARMWNESRAPIERLFCRYYVVPLSGGIPKIHLRRRERDERKN